MFNVTVNVGADSIISLGISLLLVLALPLAAILSKKGKGWTLIVLGLLITFVGYMNEYAVWVGAGVPITLTGATMVIEEMVQDDKTKKMELKKWVTGITVAGVLIVAVGVVLKLMNLK